MIVNEILQAAKETQKQKAICKHALILHGAIYCKYEHYV